MTNRIIQKFLSLEIGREVQIENSFDPGYDVIDLSKTKKNKEAINSSQSHVQYLENLYKNTPSAPECVNKINQCIFANGWYLAPKDPKKTISSVRINKLTDKFRMMKLLDIMTYMSFAYHIYGDSFIYAPTGKGSKANEAVELNRLFNCATEVTINNELRNNTGIIKINGFIYYIDRLPKEVKSKSTSNKKVNYNPDDVIHLRRESYNSYVYGRSFLDDEKATLTLGLRILNHNLNFFSNSAKPPLIIKLGEGTGKKEAQQFKNYLEMKYKGANKMWETMVTYGNTEVTELTLPDSTAFYDLLTYVRIQVCGLYSVPPSEVGVVDKTGLNNAETLHKDFVIANINAKKRMFGDFMTTELLEKRMGIDDIKIVLPYMDSMSAKQRSETNQIRLFSFQSTIDELREEQGLPLIRKDYSQELLIGNNKPLKGVARMDDFFKNIGVDEVMGGSVDEEGENPETLDSDSGRQDLDGRVMDPNESMNE